MSLHQWPKSPDLECLRMGAAGNARSIFASEYVDKDMLVGKRQMIAM